MRLTPETPIEVVKDVALRPVPGWPDGFKDWPNVQEAFRQMMRERPTTPPSQRFAGRGIVTAGGGPRHFACLWVTLARLRELGCKLPIEVWYLGDDELDPAMKALLREHDVELVNGRRRGERRRTLNGWELKPHAVLHSRFAEVLWLDGDCTPTRDPTNVFDWPEYQRTGAIFWPDYPHWDWTAAQCQVAGVSTRPRTPTPVGDAPFFGFPIKEGHMPSFESGQFVVNKVRHAHAVALTCWLCDHSDYWFHHFHGDKDMFGIAWDGRTFAMPRIWPNWDHQDGAGVMLQHDFRGEVLFHHRTQDKDYRKPPTLPGEDRCKALHATLMSRWDGRIWGEDVVAGDRTPHAGVYSYWRVGFEERQLELLADGRIGHGKTAKEASWAVSHGGTLAIAADDGQHTSRLERGRLGWHGREMGGCFVRMQRFVPPTYDHPTSLARPYVYVIAPRAFSEADKGQVWPITLNPDGSISGGPVDKGLRSFRWGLRGEVLTLTGDPHPPTHLTQKRGDGIWRGLWSKAPHFPVELRPC